MFYRWQKAFLKNGPGAFEPGTRGARDTRELSGRNSEGMDHGIRTTKWLGRQHPNQPEYFGYEA
jgi:hypothetical protein